MKHSITISSYSDRSHSLAYLLKEQRLLFVLIGFLLPSLSFHTYSPYNHPFIPLRDSLSSSSSFGHLPFDRIRSVHTTLSRRRSRIVITGGDGFFGSHLIDKLISCGDDVIMIDNFFTGRKENLVHWFGNPRFELIRHDVIKSILLEVDQMYHLACPASPVHYKYNPIKKIVRIARIFSTYGPRMCLDNGRVVSNLVAQAISNQPMTVYGDGKQTRSFQYVSDLVDGLVVLMEGEHVGPFNLGHPGEFTMLELAVVKETIDPSATIEFKRNTADDPHKRKPDITKAKECLIWEPKISLREGLPVMVSDFRNRILNEEEGKASK